VTLERSPLAQERLAYRRSRARRSTLVALVSTVVFAAAVFVGLTSTPGWPRVQATFLDPAIAWSSLPAILSGLWLNIRVLAVTVIGVLALGLLIAVLRTLRGPVFFPLRALATGYVDMFRGVPLLIALYLIGFGVPALRLQGVPTDVAVLGTVALILVYSAYVAEVFRAGIESVHWSQTAAARSLGFGTLQTWRHVIVPQALRRVVAPLLSYFVGLQKDTALVLVVGAIDAFGQAKIFAGNYFNLSSVTFVALVFIAITIPQTRFVDYLLARDARKTGVRAL
jgi:polar amino acid transport system permease protein